MARRGGDRDTDAAGEGGVGHRVECRLDELLARRGMTVTQLARRVGVTVVNLSVLKNNRARAVRFSTLTALCDALDCQPGDLFRVVPGRPGQPTDRAPSRSA
ncbi:helix-turn-helix domain-containing protein [Actinopolymorpha singaporensis]|uniref:Putative transcriptional regulator n=1 Tax=Actinopolymorpha singaporensis TaxID=117157 RepID=A0A1H1XU47_9ACTN|nr:helix-turn-helix transcriptional regulator [Actinopolymorpha singaporensis]SDT12551.1 putative transcriptional regulator [Actinopolymorpha singaporensis]